MSATGATSGEVTLGSQPPPAERSLRELDDAISALAADISAATCRWLSLVAEFDRRGGHEEFGFVACSSWLAWRCSLTPRAAREQLRIARSLERLPRIRASFAAGTLSYSKVRALSRVAEPEMEPELVELAHEATAAQLERLLRGYRGAIADDYARSHERRHLRTSWDDDGSLVIRGSLPAEEGAILLKALELAREELVRGRPTEGSPNAQGAPESQASPKSWSLPGSTENERITNADALLAVAESALAGGMAAVPGGDRHQIVVHVDVGELASAAGSEGAAGEVGDSVPIPAETVRRLGCDAAIVALLERDGKPLSVGRKTRSIPPSIARALRARDRRCQFPGCERELFVDAHHIRHWAQGGETSLDNLVRLCRNHHRLVHEGGFGLERRRGSLVFRGPNGHAIPDSTRDRSPARALPSLTEGVGGPDGRIRDCRPRSRGERMDLDLGVLALAALHERRTKLADVPARAGPPAELPVP